jgi:DNA repair exonuclease SbcCD ATPase subunit
MIHFENIKFRNFLSTGDAWTQIDLSRSPTTLVLGENGSGKSTMLDALCFALFGKPFRKINKPQLANSINEKNCLVEVNFRIGSNSYRVLRGIKPAKFEIYYNDTLLDQTAAVKDYQEHLEKNILKLNYTSFTQVVILGSSTFIPFMQLSAQARREVIEDLLDIKIFSVMNVLLKTRIQENKEILNDLKYQLQMAQEKRALQQKHMKELRSQNEERVNEINAEIEKSKTQLGLLVLEKTGILKSIEENEETQRSKYKGVLKKFSDLEKYQGQIQTKQNKLMKDRDFYLENADCLSCGQSLPEDFRNNKLETLQESISDYGVNLSKLETELEKTSVLKDELKVLEEEYSSLVEKKFSCDKDIDSHHSYMRKLEKQLSNVSNVDMTTTIEELKVTERKIIEVEKQREEAVKQRELYTVAAELLKDKGIKTQIVKQYVPVMNKLINKYLAKMEFFVNFELDENFNEVIKSRHRDVFSYASFSEGEKARLDLALLLTWRSIAKMKNSSHTNLLILDEVFDGSLDNVGIESLMEILNETQDTNIFIISHKGESLQDKMRSIIRFEKWKNFSRMVAT